ncbi:MAG: zinc-ribbon domain-containing protein [Prevotellaceae bacterium]|jgi:DNA-directed RNA polymerase subunit RPC12/RpoP|nr:zinc-ribbon domain-containing protein [Prevotellaceae bacterium]
MSLINCSECGKQVSDKAMSCPNCGNPINQNLTTQNKDEEYLCCPHCNSKDLHSEKKGFSGGKALAGAVLTGGIGLLAGTIGSKDVQITCLKCGKKFKAGEAKIVRSMSDATEKQLEDRVLFWLCENNTIEAENVYMLSTGCSRTMATQYILSVIDKVPALRTEEQKEKAKKYYEDMKNKKGGCLGICLILITATIGLIL